MRMHSGVIGGLAFALAAVACGDDESAKFGDKDGDGWARPLDCDNSDVRVFPGADEVPYDGIDQDCSGSDLTDVDDDGYDGGIQDPGAAGAAGAAGAGAGAAGEAEDCDDTRPDVHPAGIDSCDDGIDQDCSGSDQACDALDADGDGVSAANGDCNDDDASVGPEQDEIPYNGSDDDCDASTQDGDLDSDGFANGSGGDCDDEDADVFPGADEVPYDGIDQDCSGTDLMDVDADGAPGGTPTEGVVLDCDDLDASIGPDRRELVLDGVDQDCDGSDLAGTTQFSAMNSTSAVPEDVPALAGGITEAGHVTVLAAWADSRTAPSQAIYAHAFRSDGSAWGQELEVATAGLAKSNVQIAADAPDFGATRASKFLVTWETLEGVFGRLMHAEGANAEETQIAPAGAVDHRLAFGGGNFAIAWRQSDVSPSELRVRMLSTAGVKGDNLLIVADDAAREVTLAGREDGLVSLWTSAGIWGRALDGLGASRGEVFEVSPAFNVGSPAIAASEAGYYVAYQRSTAPSSVFGLAIDAEGQPESEAVRLSDDALTITDLSVVATDAAYLVAWSDARHVVVPPGYGAIYASQVGYDGTPLSFIDRPLHVELKVQLGGIAWVGGPVLMTSRRGDTVGVLVPPL